MSSNIDTIVEDSLKKDDEIKISGLYAFSVKGIDWVPVIGVATCLYKNISQELIKPIPIKPVKGVLRKGVKNAFWLAYQGFALSELMIAVYKYAPAAYEALDRIF